LFFAASLRFSAIALANMQSP